MSLSRLREQRAEVLTELTLARRDAWEAAGLDHRDANDAHAAEKMRAYFAEIERRSEPLDFRLRAIEQEIRREWLARLSPLHWAFLDRHPRVRLLYPVIILLCGLALAMWTGTMRPKHPLW